MSKRIRLTKQRLAALDHAISIDDIMYERFRRMQEDLRKHEERIYRAKQIVKVVQKQKNGVMLALRIDSVEVTPDGTLVVVC